MDHWFWNEAFEPTAFDPADDDSNEASTAKCLIRIYIQASAGMDDEHADQLTEEWGQYVESAAEVLRDRELV